MDIAYQLLKRGDFYFNPDKLRGAGQFNPAKTTGTTTVDFNKPRWWKPSERNLQQDYDDATGKWADTKLADLPTIPMTDENTVLNEPIMPPHTQPFTQEERTQRGEFATPDEVEFRRGASRPNVHMKESDMVEVVSNLQDREGNYIQEKVDRTNTPMYVNQNQPQNVGGMRSYPTMYGVNLAAYGQRGFGNPKNPEESIPDIATTQLHEGVHMATDEPIKQAIKEGITPAANYKVAQEIGAHTGQEFADPGANLAMQTHPALQGDSQQLSSTLEEKAKSKLWTPRPIEASGNPSPEEQQQQYDQERLSQFFQSRQQQPQVQQPQVQQPQVQQPMQPEMIQQSEPMDIAMRLLKNEEQWRQEAKFLPTRDLEGQSMGVTEALVFHPNFELFEEAGHPEDRLEEFFGTRIAEEWRRARVFEDEWGFREQEEDDQLREMGLYEEPITSKTQDKLDYAPDVFMEHERHNIRNLPSGGHTHETVPAFGNVNIRTPAPVDEHQYGVKVGPDMQKYPLVDMEENRFSPWQTDSEYGNLRNTRQGGFSAQDQMKYTGEPMDIAMRLLKAQRLYDALPWDKSMQSFEQAYFLIKSDDIIDLLIKMGRQDDALQMRNMRQFVLENQNSTDPGMREAADEMYQYLTQLQNYLGGDKTGESPQMPQVAGFNAPPLDPPRPREQEEVTGAHEGIPPEHPVPIQKAWNFLKNEGRLCSPACECGCHEGGAAGCKDCVPEGDQPYDDTEESITNMGY